MTVTDLAPDLDEVEVSVFGRGSGECVLVHLGGHQWMVVDSFREPRSRRPIAQVYLEELGLDPGESIAAIVATHWHDDHIHGLTELVELAPTARFICSGALDQAHFYAINDLYNEFEPPSPLTSGVREFAQIFARLGARRAAQPSDERDPDERYEDAAPTWAFEDKRVCFRADAAGKAIVTALSPSDGVQAQTYAHFAELRAAAGPLRMIPRGQPNDLSVVLWVEIGGQIVLLGADLERVVRGPGGWGSVTRTLTPEGRRAMVFKVPHHGSENAHDDRAWEILLGQDAHAALTPYQKLPRPLPRATDLERLGRFTSRVYIAGAHERTPYEPGLHLLDPSEPVVGLALASPPQPLHGAVGQARFRSRMGDPPTAEAWAPVGRGRVTSQ